MSSRLIITEEGRVTLVVSPPPVTTVVVQANSAPAKVVIPKTNQIFTVGNLLGRKGDKGDTGESAYEIAVDTGFVGTEEEWITSLIGYQGSDGDSAYDLAVENGFVGTEEEWIASLEGLAGTDGSRWYSGDGAPDSGLGVEADWYFDDSSGNIYEKIASDTWELRRNLIGEPGEDGTNGLSAFIVQSGATYPDRPVGTGGVFTYIGTADPGPSGLNVAAAGDIWIDPTATPSLAAITATLLDAAGDLIVASGNDNPARLPIGSTNGFVLTIDTSQALKMKWAALPPSLPNGGTIGQYLKKNSSSDGDASWATLTIPPSTKDLRWAVPTGHISIDEFNDDSIDPAYVYTGFASYPAAAKPIYRELGDALAVKYGSDTGIEAITSDGASARHMAILRPLSGIGGSMANGDAFYTAFDVIVRNNANYRMSGLVLANSATSTGAQLYSRWWSPGTVGFRTMTDWSGDNSVGSSDAAYRIGITYQRIVRISSTTWRMDVSIDGIRWIHGIALATWAFEPTHVGFCESQWGSGVPSSTSYEFLRKQTGVS